MSIKVRFFLCLTLMIPSLVLLAPVQAEAGTISAIRFAGNHVTQERILRQELTIRVGDPVDQKKIQTSRQSIMDLGLFQSVAATVNDAGEVLFSVKEKHYFLLIPRFSHDSDTNEIQPGARLTINNIAGLNQRLRLTFIQSDPPDADHGKQNELGFEYHYPKVGGGKYNFTTAVNFIESPVQAALGGSVVSEYEKDSVDARLFVSRWWRKTAPSSGWLTGAGLRLQKRDYRYVSGDRGAFVDDHAVSILAEVRYINVHDHLFSRSGIEYGYSIEQGLKDLGSDYGYNRHLFFYRRFMTLHKLHHNLNVQARLGVSGGAADNLGGSVYDIRGYGDLRAYDDPVEGDAFVLLNIEYLRPLLGRNYMRGLLFVDAGNTYANNSDIDLSDFKWAGGLGARWRIKGFVDLDLSLEYAFNFEDSSDRYYFRTSGAF